MKKNLCIETICVENRKIVREIYHNNRLNKTRKGLYGSRDIWTLSEMIAIPDDVTDVRHKLRIVYGEKIEHISWALHTPRIISSLKKVYDNRVDYSYKFEDRRAITELFNSRGNADEILIIKNGMVSDCFFYNVAFGDGNKWYTPDTNLLPGTQRAFLLDTGVIEVAQISGEQILNYSHVRLFNALVDWDSAPELEIGLIS